jgi:hypothetical protein
MCKCRSHARPAQLQALKRWWLIFTLVFSSVIFPSARAYADDPIGGPGGSTSDRKIIIRQQTLLPGAVNTLIEIPVTQDAFISAALPDTNFGFADSLNIGYNATGYQAMRLLLQFDLSSIPANASLNSAQLQLWQYSSTPASDSPMDYQAQFVNAGWNEGTVTWNKTNYLGGLPQPIGAASSSTGWQYLDVTHFARVWQSGAQANYGILVTGDESSQHNRLRNSFSKEKPDLYPRLLVDYDVTCDTVPPTAGVNALPVYTPASFAVSWNAYDSTPPGCLASGIDYYDLQYSIDGHGWVDWLRQTKQTSAVFNYAGNNSLVEFRARAVDGVGNLQPWSDAQASTQVDSEPPAGTVNPLPQYTFGDSFPISWTGSDNLAGIAYYDVQARVDDLPWGWLVQHTLQTSYFLTGAESGRRYQFRARAVDNLGNSQTWSETYQAETTVFAHPVSTIEPFDPPVIKPTLPITTSFGVSWSGSSAPGSPITNYAVYYQYSAGPWTLWRNFSGTVTSADFEWQSLGLGDGLYQFEVAASDSAGTTEPLTHQAEASIIVDVADRIQPRVYVPLLVIAHKSKNPEEMDGTPGSAKLPR